MRDRRTKGPGPDDELEHAGSSPRWMTQAGKGSTTAGLSSSVQRRSTPDGGKRPGDAHARIEPPRAGARRDDRSSAWEAGPDLLAALGVETAESAEPEAEIEHADEGVAPTEASVQLRATEAAEPDQVHAAAVRGIATPSQPLPHQGRIEASLGMDLSHVAAHVGGDAAASAQAMGAEAYATGDHVVLPASPSLETTAHEVAHVVQQGAGVQLKGGVGEVGDAYERQADEVASRVVRGESAADLLPDAARSTGTSAVQRSPAPDDSTSITAAQYWAQHGGLTGIQVGLRLPAEATILLDVAGLTLPAARRADFLRPLTRVLRGNPSWEEMELYLAEPLTSIIDGVRVVDERGYGPAKPEPAIADRLVERFTFAIRASTHRLAPRYAQEKARLLASHEPRDGDPEPDPSALAPTRPLDGALAAGFCSGAVMFDLQAFQGRPSAKIAGLGPPVPVELALERGRGDWMMVRVVSPPAATPQDVANELFGSPDRVHLMAGASGRYAFRFPPGGDLAPRWQAAWEQHVADDDLSLAHVLSLRINPPDPAVAFTDASNQDGAAARVIGPAPPPRGNEGTVQRLGMLDDLLTSMATSAVAFGMADALGPIQERIRARRHNCTLDAGEAARWAGHTDEQLAVVGQAADGLAAMAQQMKAMGLGQSTAKGEQLPDVDLSALLQGPVREVAAAFLRAAAAAELLDVARERLATAQARLAVYPVDMIDRLLVSIRARNAVMAPRQFLHRTFDQGRVEAIEARIQHEVVRLRQAIANGAPEVQFALAAIQQQVLVLDFVSSVGSTMSAIEALKGDLFQSESWSANRQESDSIRARLNAALGPWQNLAQLYEDTVKAGKDMTPEWVAFFRSQLDSLRASSELPQLLEKVKSFERDEQTRQKWISIGVIIGAIVATAVTGGMAGGIAPGIGGAAIAAGVEAFTFTSLTYGTLAQDITFGGFVAQLGINFATFGGFKGIHYAGKALAAAHGASLGLTLTEITAEGLWAAASAKANEAIMARVAAGEPMTQQSAAAIFGENLLIAAATRLVARAGGLFLAHIKGADSLPEVQVANAERAQVRLLADQVLATKDAQLGEAMLAADTRALGAERKALDRVHHLATHPAEAKQLGIEIDPAAAPQLQEMSAERAFAEAEREVAELTAKVTQFGDQALARPDVFDPLLAAHRRMGSEVAKATDELGGIKATIRPRSADGAFGEPLTIHLEARDDFTALGGRAFNRLSTDLGRAELRRILDQIGVPAARRFAESGMSGAELRDVVRVFRRDGIQMGLAEGLSVGDFTALLRVDEGVIRKLLLELEPREVAKILHGIGPDRLGRMGSELKPAQIPFLHDSLGAARLAGLLDVLTPRGVLKVQRYASDQGLQALERAAALERAGKLRGLDDWAEFSTEERYKNMNEIKGRNKRRDAEKDFRNVIGELWEAERLAHSLGPDEIIVVGRDNQAAIGDKSIDLAIEQGGKVKREIEVATVVGAVRAVDINEGVMHAVNKSGVALTGAVESTVRVSFKKTDRQGPNRTKRNPNGIWVTEDPAGNVRAEGDYLEELAEHMNKNVAKKPDTYKKLVRVHVTTLDSELLGTIELREGAFVAVRK